MPVRITKLSETPDSEWPASEWSAFVPGSGLALPVGYTMDGTLAAPIEIGSPIVLLRTVRNGVVQRGIFTSTNVREILLVTKNSIYRVETVPHAPERCRSV